MITREIVKISKMSCASCSANIENKLKKEKGIMSVNINFASEKANLEFDDEQIKIEKIEKIIESLGYEVEKDKNLNKKKSKKTKIKSDKTILFGISSLGIIIFYLAMGEMFSWPIPKILSGDNNHLIQFGLASVVVFMVVKIWKNGFKNILKMTPNMDSLVFIGTFSAYFYSLINLFKEIFLGINGLHLYFESAALILIFITLGKYLENLSKGRTSEVIKKLIGLQAKTATVIRGNKEETIEISRVIIGDIIIIKPGEKIPVDGIVIDGYSAVDEKMISGESIPVEKNKNDRVIGSTLNKSGFLKIKAEKIGKETMLAQIIKIVEEAMGSKAPIQLLADKVSFYFVPTVIFIAIISFSTWLILGQSFSFALTSFVAVLIIACPCALGLATPTAIMVGTGIAAENGILIKNSRALETAKNIDTFVFDKTGTLTNGTPVLTDIIKIKKGIEETEVLKIAASIEKKSEHPLAQAILNKAKLAKIEIEETSDFQTLPGQGIRGIWREKEILLGTKRLMTEKNINCLTIESKMEKMEKEGKTVIILAMEKEILALFAIADTLKNDSIQMITAIHKMGKNTVMLSGDNIRVAKAIAAKLGIKKVLAEIMPSDKAREIEKMQDEGHIVAMIGDGINDAPAIAKSNLGIAIGSGTDIAIETGDIVLIKSKLADIIKAINISKYTFKKIKQNLFWAFFYNIIGIPIAAGILFPISGKLLSPEIAALAMAFSSVSVVSNSLIMRRKKF
ncbi:heavy metal translocating P-type ATPase [Candidatus Falkowbacteria bacterium HGW-Falkowbacteria-1]|uniref:Heavy metal translocating P-type ATPase n=1 Tax=Candidatus Falkowbacteria bacterium HGW-Falkowbacteria-1 TaxID=2013768 RepID=A0A2N2E999_9BACT|nr:MAG: heavy metal translocating P-type ATPase [Candidatus Falkowbacteria bacterium HGW-Falkowbacteria-1]